MEKRDADVKKMAKVLLEGAKMLDMACPVCNNPIFQYKSGEKVCAVCERKVIVESDDDTGQAAGIVEKKAVRSKKGKKGKPNESMAPVNSQPPIVREPIAILSIFQHLKDICTEKLDFLASLLETSDDLETIERILSSIKDIMAILDSLKFA
jgi:uncharacterized Zn finger protein (UPF0148 family)